MTMQFKDLICYMRQEAGMTRRGFAAAAGLSHGAIGAWETGASIPSLPNLQSLARVSNMVVSIHPHGWTARRGE